MRDVISAQKALTPVAGRSGDSTLGRGGVKVVIVTNQVPGHDAGLQHSGHAQYLSAFLQHFERRGYEVVLIVLRPKVDFFWRARASFNVTIVGPSFRTVKRWVLLASPSGVARVLAWRVYARLPRFAQSAIGLVRLALRRTQGYVHTLGSFPSSREIAYVRNIAEKLEPTIVMYDGLFNSCGRLNSAQHWVITHEVKHERAASFRDRGVSISPASFTENCERTLLAQIGNIIAIQWDDGKAFERLLPKSRVVVVPVTMTSHFEQNGIHAVAGRCLFVGSGSYHNYDGIKWFIDECWPRVRELAPNATLDVVGSVCYRLSLHAAGVSFHGVVEALDDFYARASVTVVPLRIGSGLKVKLIEALSHRQAIVTTAIGAQGLMNFSPRPFIVADSSEEFSAQTAALLTSSSGQTDLRDEAGKCIRVFDPGVAFAQLDEAIARDLSLP